MSKKTENKRGRRGGKAFRSWLLFLALTGIILVGVSLPYGMRARAFDLLFELECWFAVPCPVTDPAAEAFGWEKIAEDTAYFAKQLTKYTDIYENWRTVDKAMKLGLDNQTKAEDEGATTDTAGSQGVVQAWTDIGQASADSELENKQLENNVKVAAETTKTPPSDQYLCNKIVSCQAEVLTRPFARQIARIVGEGVMMRYRGAKDDGAGVDYAVKEEGIRCGRYVSVDDLKFGSDVDGYSDDCLGPEMGPLDIGLKDADISSRILSGEVTLEVPPMKQETLKTAAGDVKISVPNPDKENAAQLFWMAAIQYCYQLAGPRPSPPHGRDMATPAGRVARAQWNHCASLQNAFIKQCADRVGNLSRPDCSVSELKPYCDELQKACYSAQNADFQPGSVASKCGKGYSLNQAVHDLCHPMCGSGRQEQSSAMGGATDPEMQKSRGSCQIVSDSGETRSLTEDMAFLAAVKSMKKLNECWSAVQYR